MDNADWDNLPGELLGIILHKLSSSEDYVKLLVVSKYWRSALSEYEKPLLPPESPILLLAEQVAEGGALEFEKGSQESGGDLENNDDLEEDSGIYEPWYDERNNYSVGSTRGLYRLATGKTYYIELPEASGKLIVGTNKGWLVTLGKDLQVNLLHPLLREQIPLPPMNNFPDQWEDMEPEQVFHWFIRKVAISSQLRGKYAEVDNGKRSPNSIIMAIHGMGNYLAFARLGDKEWTNVEITKNFDDIAYYNGNFYAVDFNGSVFVCDIDDHCSTERRARGTEIACPHKLNAGKDQYYLVESGSGLWLVVRIRGEQKFFGPPHDQKIMYRTTDFLVWKLELKYSDDHPETPLCTCIQKNSLGEDALFVGGATGRSLPSSEEREYIKPNCIYFTDDYGEFYKTRGRGHDMGIFNMESRTIEPHFQGKSIHPVSPPLWYI